ncbi:diguanylate cyclase domain-containing protein [Dactylosporangium siamense]|uniref:GGDEF domain-containing protein n=1 Tax=Dactylosporangium siamense TaxID=685454 RepID=A0A919Q287_9ACTN|nr:GGDEF domain-containing protein [Dactylosporangium siamense]GIG52938.1 hypothetical protein Dsi01nite_109790 [Dactylosporangium siamense]
MRAWSRRVPTAHLSLVLLYAAAMAVLLTGVLSVAPSLYPNAAEVCRMTFGVVGLVAALRVTRRPTLDPRTRKAWRAMAVSFAILVVSPVLLLVFAADSISSADDVTHIAFVVALLAAVQLFPLPPTSRRGRWKTALDALTVLVGGSMVLWFTSFGPYLDRRGLTADAAVSIVVYPIADLVLLFSVARVLVRGPGGAAHHPIRTLAAGAIVLLAGDAVHGYLSAHGQAEVHSGWQFACWITADALLAAAAVEQLRAGERTARRRQQALLPARALPIIAVGGGHTLMLAAAALDGSFYPWGGLAIGGATLSALVLTRLSLVQRESDEQAVTDPLTGLANRARFRSTSHRALDRGARAGRHAAVLVIDMNRFKEINDTLGHQSGDLALLAFAELLRRCVPQTGLPARLGGDEFAVVLPDLDNAAAAERVAARIAASTQPVTIDGTTIELAASIGVAVSAPGELTHDTIVHRADRAMYRAKQLGPQTHWISWDESFEAPPSGVERTVDRQPTSA